MSILFPTAPSSGKNAKLYMTKDDGTKLNGEAMIVKDSFEYRGQLYAKRVYTLGAGKTLINMRPAVQPRVDINCVLVGCEILPHEDKDKLTVMAGIIEVNGSQVSVAGGDLDFSTDRPTGSNELWLAIKTTANGTIGHVKGTENTTLNNSYGTAAGNRPFIPVEDILLGLVKVKGSTSANVQESDIEYDDRETYVETKILPNVGAALLDSELVKCHTNSATRTVSFTGNYLDKSLSLINSGKGFTLTPKTDEVSDTTFDDSYGESTVSGYSFTFEQLATDRKAIDAAYKRGGHCAVRFQWPNGYFQQTVGTLAPTLTVNPTSYNSVSVAGQCGDFPAQSSDL